MATYEEQQKKLESAEARLEEAQQTLQEISNDPNIAPDSFSVTNWTQKVKSAQADLIHTETVLSNMERSEDQAAQREVYATSGKSQATGGLAVEQQKAKEELEAPKEITKSQDVVKELTVTGKGQFNVTGTKVGTPINEKYVTQSTRELRPELRSTIQKEVVPKGFFASAKFRLGKTAEKLELEGSKIERKGLKGAVKQIPFRVAGVGVGIARSAVGVAEFVSKPKEYQTKATLVVGRFLATKPKEKFTTATTLVQTGGYEIGRQLRQRPAGLFTEIVTYSLVGTGLKRAVSKFTYKPEIISAQYSRFKQKVTPSGSTSIVGGKVGVKVGGKTYQVKVAGGGQSFKLTDKLQRTKTGLALEISSPKTKTVQAKAILKGIGFSEKERFGVVFGSKVQVKGKAPSFSLSGVRGKLLVEEQGLRTYGLGKEIVSRAKKPKVTGFGGGIIKETISVPTDKGRIISGEYLGKTLKSAKIKPYKPDIVSTPNILSSKKAQLLSPSTIPKPAGGILPPVESSLVTDIAKKVVYQTIKPSVSFVPIFTPTTKTEPPTIQLQKTDPKISTRIIQPQVPITSSVSKSVVRFDTEPIQKTVPRFDIEPIQSFTPRFDVESVQKVSPKVAQEQSQKISPALKTVSKSEFTSPIPPPVIDSYTPINDPDFIVPFLPLRKPLPSSKAFQAEVKRFGEYQAIGKPLPRGKALKLGAAETRRTLGASFRVKETGGFTTQRDISFKPSGDIFRSYRIEKGARVPLKNEFIQFAEKRLSQRTEVAEIKTFATKKKKKLKGFFGGF